MSRPGGSPSAVTSRWRSAGRPTASGWPIPSVSRRHLRVAMQDGTVTVEDLGSSYGTAVNGETITGLTAAAAGRSGDVWQHPARGGGAGPVAGDRRPGAPPLPLHPHLRLHPSLVVAAAPPPRAGCSCSCSCLHPSRPRLLPPRRLPPRRSPQPPGLPPPKRPGHRLRRPGRRSTSWPAGRPRPRSSATARVRPAKRPPAPCPVRPAGPDGAWTASAPSRGASCPRSAWSTPSPIPSGRVR